MSQQKRTNLQNNALHRYFRLMSDELNKNGITFKKAVRQDFDMMFSELLFKEAIWKPIQKSLFGETSTRELTSKQIDQIYDIINKHFSEIHEMHIPFPSIEEMIDREREKALLTKKNKSVK